MANICPGLNVYLKARHLNFPHVAVGRRDIFLEKKMHPLFFRKTPAGTMEVCKRIRQPLAQIPHNWLGGIY